LPITGQLVLKGAIGSLDVKGSEKAGNYKIGGFMRYSTSFSQLLSFYADLGAGYQNISLKMQKGCMHLLTLGYSLI